MPSVRVLDIHRMSTKDGPGLRTTVFLKGCSLACAWCHNSEAMEVEPQLVWYRSKCIGSGECITACPEQALVREGDTVEIIHARCLGFLNLTRVPLSCGRFSHRAVGGRQEARLLRSNVGVRRASSRLCVRMEP